jgi:TolA-binding protein
MVTMAPARRSNPFTIRLALLGALGLALILMIVWFGRSLGRYAESVTSGEEAAAHTREALSAREEATPGRAHGSAASLAGYRRAMELKRNSDFRGAAEMLERLAQEIPEGPVEAEVLYQLGQVYARLGDQLKADESFDYVISRYPETIHALLAHVGKAEVRRDNGDPEGAVWEFEAAVRLLPLDHDHKRRAEVLFKYAWLLAETQRSDAAIDAYKQIIELRADQETTARAYLEMAELQAKMGDVDLAKENYLEAKRTAPAASYVRRVADERLAELELIDRPLSGG